MLAVVADVRDAQIMIEGRVAGIDGVELGAGVVRRARALVTGLGAVVGTPSYIAPEQVHRRPITEKTDIYNLGATMYWALTRKHVPTALGKEDSLLGTLDKCLETTDRLRARKSPIQVAAACSGD